MPDQPEHISPELFEQIENYLLNRMDTQTRKQFEAGMRQNKALQDEVNLQRKLFATVEAQVFSSLQQPGKQPAPVKKMIPVWRYAAAAVLVLAATALWLFNKPGDGKTGLFAKHFHPDPGLPVVMSSTNAYTFYDAMVSYKEGDYKKAIVVWQQLEKEQGITDTLQYYIGVSYLNSDSIPLAIKNLEPVAGNDTSSWQDHAKWYLALCAVKQENLEKARQWLNQLPGDERAKQLLSDIEKRSSR